MLRSLITVFFLLTILSPSVAQNEFNGTFKFLDVPVFALQSGIGGINVSLNEGDVNLITSNPALMGKQLDKNLSLSYILYPGDIKISNVSYLTEVGNSGMWGANIVYFNYGTIQGYDDSGAESGEFNASEYAITISKSHRIDNYQFGANIKYAYSGIAGYSTSALIADLGGVFIHPQRDFTVGIAIKNLGVVLSDYTVQSNSKVPLNVQVGSSFKPTYMPVRFSFTMYDLTNWSTYDENAESAGMANPSGIDNFFRHTIFGAQFLLGKNVEILFGYDHKQRQELKLPEVSGSSGFSYGFLIGIQTFEVGFSRRGYHVGGASNTFTLTSDLGRWIKKKSNEERND